MVETLALWYTIDHVDHHHGAGEALFLRRCAAVAPRSPHLPRDFSGVQPFSTFGVIQALAGQAQEYQEMKPRTNSGTLSVCC